MDSFTTALLAQFQAMQAEPIPEPQIKPLPLPPEQVRRLLAPPDNEHCAEAI